MEDFDKMITSRQLANTIQDARNALAADAPFTFAVYAEVGDFQGGKVLIDREGGKV